MLQTFNDKASAMAVLAPNDFATKWGEGKCDFIDRD